MKKTIALLVILAMAMGVMFGCSKNDAGSGKVLNYCLDGDINSPDPNFRTLTAEHNLYRQIYEPLYFVNHDSGEMEPRLAESYEISPDGLTYTFKIKEALSSTTALK